MKGFPKVLKTKEDYYNCLAMVASGELAAADLLAKIESAENQRYIECGVATVEEEKKAVTVYYCDEAAVGMKFVAGDVSGTVQGVTHIQTDEAAAAGEAGNDRTALTLSKAVKAGCMNARHYGESCRKLKEIGVMLGELIEEVKTRK